MENYGTKKSKGSTAGLAKRGPDTTNYGNKGGKSRKGSGDNVSHPFGNDKSCVSPKM